MTTRPFAFAVQRAPENGPDQWRLFMDEGEARTEALQLDGDYEALFRVGDRRSAIEAIAATPTRAAPPAAVWFVVGLCIGALFVFLVAG